MSHTSVLPCVVLPQVCALRTKGLLLVPSRFIRIKREKRTALYCVCASSSDSRGNFHAVGVHGGAASSASRYSCCSRYEVSRFASAFAYFTPYSSSLVAAPSLPVLAATFTLCVVSGHTCLGHSVQWTDSLGLQIRHLRVTTTTSAVHGSDWKPCKCTCIVPHTALRLLHGHCCVP